MSEIHRYTDRGGRLAWADYFMLLAEAVSKRGSCDRRQVGAVITTADHRVISTGYNGGPSRLDDCDRHGHELAQIGDRISCVRTIHAEVNAILSVPVSLEGHTIYVNTPPCYECAKLIVQVGISKVVFKPGYASRFAEKTLNLLTARCRVLEYATEWSLTRVCTEPQCLNEARYEDCRCGLHTNGEAIKP